LRTIDVPQWLAGAAFRVGDLAGLLGWRAPLRSTLNRELARGVSGDPAEWTRLTGIVPRSLQAALAAEPASVQERWFAQLYLLKPAALATLGLYWVATGLIAMGPGAERAASLLEQAGIGAPRLLAATSSLADILIGIGIAFRRTARMALWAALALSLAYLAAGTLLLGSLWDDPLGPLLKIAPIAALVAVALAILDER
jgi:hypothetical protein